MDYSVLASARAVHQGVASDFLGRQNVVACGLGYKIKGEQQTQELSLMVSVTHKVPVAELAAKDIIPQAVSGLPTDVVETGRIRALALEDPRARWRPAPPGVSIGHRDITAGTFGLLVYREGRGYILSNNHVLANINAGQIGDPIYQPGPADGGTSNDRIGALVEYEPLDFGDAPAECKVAQTLANILNWIASRTGSEHRLQPIRQTSGVNLMDVALALPDQADWVKPDILGIGVPVGATEPELGQSVQKMGRTTGLTQGIVTQVNVTVDVDYLGRTARFADQVFTSPMSSPGDSGSGILTLDRQVVGLLFAGSEQTTIFTPISRILDRFSVTVVA